MFWLFNPPEPCANPATTQDRWKFALGKSRFVAESGAGAGHCTAVPDVWQIAPEPGSTGAAQNLFPGGRSLCQRVHNDRLSSWQSDHVGVPGYTQKWDLYHGVILPDKSPGTQWFLGLFVISDVLNAPPVSWFWALPIGQPFRCLSVNRLELTYVESHDVISLVDGPTQYPQFITVKPWYP